METTESGSTFSAVVHFSDYLYGNSFTTSRNPPTIYMNFSTDSLSYYKEDVINAVKKYFFDSGLRLTPKDDLIPLGKESKGYSSVASFVSSALRSTFGKSRDFSSLISDAQYAELLTRIPEYAYNALSEGLLTGYQVTASDVVYKRLTSDGREYEFSEYARQRVAAGLITDFNAVDKKGKLKYWPRSYYTLKLFVPGDPIYAPRVIWHYGTEEQRSVYASRKSERVDGQEGTTGRKQISEETRLRNEKDKILTTGTSNFVPPVAHIKPRKRRSSPTTDQQAPTTAQQGNNSGTTQVSPRSNGKNGGTTQQVSSGSNGNNGGTTKRRSSTRKTRPKLTKEDLTTEGRARAPTRQPSPRRQTVEQPVQQPAEQPVQQPVEQPVEQPKVRQRRTVANVNQQPTTNVAPRTNGNGSPSKVAEVNIDINANGTSRVNVTPTRNNGGRARISPRNNGGSVQVSPRSNGGSVQVSPRNNGRSPRVSPRNNGGSVQVSPRSNGNNGRSPRISPRNNGGSPRISPRSNGNGFPIDDLDLTVDEYINEA